MKNHLIETVLSIVVSVPLLLFVIPYFIEMNNIVATFVALALGIWVSGYMIYAIAMLIGALAMKMEELSSVITIRNEDDK